MSVYTTLLDLLKGVISGSGADSLNVTVSSIPLPPGAATSSNQDSEITLLQAIANLLSQTSIFFQDTFSAAGNTSTGYDSQTMPVKHFAFTATVLTGSITAWNVVLEGSLNGVNYTTIATHTNSTGTGIIQWSTSSTPCTTVRSRVVSLTGTGTIQATIFGVQ